MSISEGFFAVCENAIPAESKYVSLYLSVPFYGGPEEGGWWGSDEVLIAYQKAETEEAAEAMEKAIQEYAKALSADASRKHGEHCLRQLEWCERRGIDDSNSVFGEDDGPSRYWVAIEDHPGESASRGDRHWS